MITRIEPKLTINFEKIANFGKQFSNLKSIISSLNSYIINKVGKQKLTLTSDLIELIPIKQLIDKNQDTLIFLSELILFLSSISSIKDAFVEKVSSMEEKLVFIYINSVEKFTKIEEEKMSLMKSTLPSYFDEEDTNMKQISDNHAIVYNNFENEISSLRDEIEKLKQEKKELEITLNNKNQEYEYLEKNNKQNMLIQEQLTETSLKNTELITQLNEKMLEIEKLKEENKIEILSLKKINKKLGEENDKLSQQMIDYSSLTSSFNKLKEKYRQMESKGDSITANLMSQEIDKKNSQIDSFVKERKSLLEKIENLTNENYKILQEKQKSEVKIRQYESELKEKENNKDFRLINSEEPILVSSFANGICLGEKLEMEEKEKDKEPLTEIINEVEINYDEKIPVANFASTMELKDKNSAMMLEYQNKIELLEKDVKEKNDSIIQLKQEIDQIKEQYRKEQNDSIILKQEIEQIKENSIQEKNESVMQLQQEIDKMKSLYQIEKNEKEKAFNKELEDKVKVFEDEKMKSDELIKTLTLNLEESQKLYKDMVKSKEDIIKNLQNDLGLMKTESVIKYSALEKEKEELVFQINTLTSQMDNLKQELSSQSLNSQGNENSIIQELTIKLTKCENEMLKTKLDKELNEKNKNELHQLEIEKLNTEIKELQSGIEGKIKEIRELQNKNDKQKNEINELQKESDKLKKDISELKSVSLSKDIYLQDFKETIKEKDSMINQKKQEILQLKELNEQNKKLILSLKEKQVIKQNHEQCQVVNNIIIKETGTDCDLPLKSLQGTFTMSEILFDCASALLNEEEN